MHHSDLTDIIEKATEVVFKACSINHHEGNKGGYLCITDHKGIMQATILIGDFSESSVSAESHLKLCQEKAYRLAQYDDHLSSWQSRDHSAAKYGGAIRVREFILSFSGLPELWNEACMLALGYNIRIRLISREHVEDIRKISGNPHVSRLIAATMDESQKNRM